MSNLYPNLFQPITIGGRTLKNRIMSAPNMLFQVVNGRPTDYYVGYLEHKAKGGAAMILKRSSHIGVTLKERA